VISGRGLPNLVSLTLSAQETLSKALNSKQGGLLPTLFLAPPAQLPQLTCVPLCGYGVGASTPRFLLIPLHFIVHYTQVPHPRNAAHGHSDVEAPAGPHPPLPRAGPKGEMLLLITRMIYIQVETCFS
jgi:hypothetical protein